MYYRLSGEDTVDLLLRVVIWAAFIEAAILAPVLVYLNIVLITQLFSH